jgi:acetyltransferase-like isoleucine patch superfamily enzyme
MGLRRLVQKLKLRYGSDATVVRTLREMGMRVGDRCRVYTQRIGSEPWLIRIGDHVVIAPDVSIITHDAANWLYQDRYESLTSFGKVDIRDNCYIGLGAIILPGVTIGPDSIVGAGAVVTKDVPPRAVVAGNPARFICSIEDHEKKVVAGHIDIPKDPAAARRVLERHFWGEDSD